MTAANVAVPKKLLKGLKKAIKKQLAPAKVVDVRAKGWEGIYGDPYLRVYIIFEKLDVLAGIPETKKFMELCWIVRPMLKKAGDTRWPLFALRTKDEMSDVPT